MDWEIPEEATIYDAIRILLEKDAPRHAMATIMHDLEDKVELEDKKQAFKERSDELIKVGLSAWEGISNEGIPKDILYIAKHVAYDSYLNIANEITWDINEDRIGDFKLLLQDYKRHGDFARNVYNVLLNASQRYKSGNAYGKNKPGTA